MKRALLVLAIVGAWWTFGDAQPVHACTCDSLLADAEVMLQSPDIAAVFVGTITGEQRPPERNIVSSADPVRFEFAVEEVYKGRIPAIIEVKTARASSSCGFGDSAGIGDRMALAVQRQGDEWTSNICSTLDPASLPIAAIPIDPLPVAATEDPAGDGWALPLGVVAAVVAGGAAIVALLTYGRRRASTSP